MEKNKRIQKLISLYEDQFQNIERLSNEEDVTFTASVRNLLDIGIYTYVTKVNLSLGYEVLTNDQISATLGRMSLRSRDILLGISLRSKELLSTASIDDEGKKKTEGKMRLTPTKEAPPKPPPGRAPNGGSELEKEFDRIIELYQDSFTLLKNHNTIHSFLAEHKYVKKECMDYLINAPWDSFEYLLRTIETRKSSYENPIKNVPNWFNKSINILKYSRDNKLPKFKQELISSLKELSPEVPWTIYQDKIWEASAVPDELPEMIGGGHYV